MKNYLLHIVLFFCILQHLHSQEGGVVAFNIPARNSLKFNKQLINPTFSFVREQNKYISFNNKREWVQFDNAPQTYLFGYSGRFRENIGAGVSLFQQNYGVLTTFGGVVNFAYNAVLNRDNNLTFGINLGFYNSGLNEGNVVTNFPDSSLDNFPSNSIISINPGINYGTEFLDFGISVKNLVSYNFTTSRMIEENPEQSVQGHIMYTGYLNNRGFFDESKFLGLISSEFKKDQTVISGMVMLMVPKGIWMQAGYNSLYAASAGIGLNITSNIAIEYNYEKGVGGFSTFGNSHDITLAYKFKNNDRYYYSGDDDEEALLMSSNKKNRTIAKRRKSSKPITRKKVGPVVPDNKDINSDEVNTNKTEDTKAKDIEIARVKAEQEEQEEQEEQARIAEASRIKAEEDAIAKEIEAARVKTEQEEQARIAEASRIKTEEDAIAKEIEAARVKAEQEEQARIAEASRIKAEEEAKAKEIEATRVKAEQEEQARIAEASRIKAEEDAKAKEIEAARVKTEQEEQARIAEAARIKAEEEEAKAKEIEAARVKTEQEEQARIAEAARIKAEEEEEEAKAKEIEATRVKTEQEEQARIAEVSRIKAEEEEEAKAKEIEAARVKTEQEEQARIAEAARIKAEADAQAKLVQEERIKAEQEAQIEEIALDAVLIEFKKSTEVSKSAQQELLSQLNEKVAIKQQDLDDLKEENDLSEQGIVSAPKAFKSVSSENTEIESLKLKIDNSIVTGNAKITEIETLYRKRLQKVKDKNDAVNIAYANTIAELKSERLKIQNRRQKLILSLSDIKVATDFERRRRIKRAAYDNEDDRYNKDRAALERIKKFTQPATTPLTEDDFDHGEELSNIQIVKGVNNVDSGYYLVVAVHNDVSKRDEFLEKAVATGQKDINFFFDLNTSKYYIYYEKFDNIGQAKNSLDTNKGNKVYNSKMSMVKIEN